MDGCEFCGISIRGVSGGIRIPFGPMRGSMLSVLKSSVILNIELSCAAAFFHQESMCCFVQYIVVVSETAAVDKTQTNVMLL
jgi:hypothetical protein